MLGDDIVVCVVGGAEDDDWVVVYEEAFIEDERAPLSALRSDLAAGVRCMHKTKSADGELLCFSLIYPFIDFIWLSYIASPARHRSCGYGERHLKRLIELLKEERPGAAGLFFDIESPDAPGIDPDVQRLRSRRLGFYTRQGASVIAEGKRYFMPNFIAGRDPIPARLLWFEFGKGKVEPGRHLPLVIRNVFQAIYKLKADDPLIAELADQF